MTRALSISELAVLLAQGDEESEPAFESTGFESGSAEAPMPETELSVPSMPIAELAVHAARAAAAAEPGSVMPRHFSPDPDIARALGVMPQSSEDDPIRQAWKSGFEDGVATEKRLAREMQGEDVAALTALGEQIHQIDAASLHMLESRLRDAVVALCRQVIDDCVIAPDRLAARIQVAVRMLAATHSEKRVEVSPTDFKLLGGQLPAEWTVTANPDLARGAIRVMTPEGGVEDGPEHWKLALEEAIRTC
ncbi:MAG: FliH/SctL family protein [Sphingobium sp.]